jgi:hypothetical protein
MYKSAIKISAGYLPGNQGQYARRTAIHNGLSGRQCSGEPQPGRS